MVHGNTEGLNQLGYTLMFYVLYKIYSKSYQTYNLV